MQHTAICLIIIKCYATKNEPMFELKTQQENAHTQDVNSVAWNPVTENILASASDDGSAIIWCLKKENGDDL